MTQDNKQERPLVTFALFSYNQEQYIREAIEGAFAQTYEPLEIIISDDGSTDRTFEIMKHMVSEYDGPHEVCLRRNGVNLGLIGHVNLVLGMAKGSVLVFAAGDDISLGNRVERLVAEFAHDPNVFLVHSAAYTIGKNGLIVGEVFPPKRQSIENLVVSGSIYIGATGAIRKSLFDDFGPIVFDGAYEDLIFGVRSALCGDLKFVSEKLVKYRENIGIIFKSNNDNDRRRRRRNKIVNRIDTLRQRSRDILRSVHSKREGLNIIVEHELLRASARLDYYDDRKQFFTKLFGSNYWYYWRALYSEVRYGLGLIE